MKRSVAAFLALASANLAFASPAHAECRGIYTDMCTWGETAPRQRPDRTPRAPRFDPAAEKLKAELATYDRAMGSIYEVTRSIEGLLNEPRPASEQALSRRVDDVLTTIWPEFSSTALEIDLLRAQSNFFDVRNDALRATAARQRAGIAALSKSIPLLTARADAADARLVQARWREDELTRFALGLVNNKSSEDRAIATLLAFAPHPGVTADRLADGPQVTVLAGARAEPSVLQSAVLAPARAEPREPTGYANLTLSKPSPAVPLTDKLAVLQTVGTALQRNINDLGYSRTSTPQKQAEQVALQAQVTSLGQSLRAVDGQMREVEQRLAQANARIDVSLANALGANAVIVKEVLADMALDRLTSEMRAIVDRIAGTAELSFRIPANTKEALLEFANLGGNRLLPATGHAANWTAFVEVQGKTEAVLDRAEGFMLETVTAAGRGSPGEMAALYERVFGSVNSQMFDYIRTTGFSQLPDGHETSTLEDAAARFGEKLHNRQDGE
ncbi:MAG: hypothetical protein ACREBO_00590 [Novosphingobium sp.]